jgi:beta-lactamase class A
MQVSPTRRTFLLATVTAPLIRPLSVFASTSSGRTSPESEFAYLEKTFGGRLGVDVYDIVNDAHFGYRSGERFPMCSTFKLMLVGAVLARSMKIEAILGRRIRYAQHDVVTYSPITGKHVGHGMTVSELCKAAIQYSDNTAANLLIRMLGSVAAVTAFARSIGDTEFRLDRQETELNTAIPGDERDTSTPAAMGRSLRTLVLGDVLHDRQRTRLKDWLCGNTTGQRRIRAGVPNDWKVGDKTGSGAYGTTNDLALIWPPESSPISLAVYYTQGEAAAEPKDEIIASATRIAVSALE